MPCPPAVAAGVGVALYGAVEAARAAGYGAAGPVLSLAAEWESCARHLPA
ncbi:MAG TPA: hypothetical protein VMV17_02500 [Streptosporangiaceae bacterium]|nr:hypothetical protein [Streptosporangiaceae bacterium]